MNDIIKAAVGYIEDGFPVIPLCWPTPDGKCGCGGGHTGKQIGKAPLIKDWVNKAARSYERVLQLWSKKRSTANIGIPTDGLVVLDIDKDNGGFESKAAIEEKYGPLPCTRGHLTGGGGEQWIYSNPGGTDIKNAVKLGGYRGVDLRANGGQIVVPPSLHKSGNRYEVIDDSEIVPAPDWLVKMATEEKPTKEAKPGEPIPEGERNSTLTSLAGNMRRSGMTKEEISAALMEVNRNRCQPPLAEVEVYKIAESVARYEPAAASLGEPPEIFSAREVVKMDLPPLKSVLPGMVVAGLTIMTAKPKAGKGWWVLQAAYSVALGKNLFDGSECEKGRVLYMGLEDSLIRLQYRINEINNSTMVSRSYMKDGGLHLYVNFGNVPEGLDLTIRWPKINEGCIEYLEKYLDEHPDTRLIIIDIFKRIAKAKKGKGSTYEEDYESIQPVHELATRRTVAVIVVHHNRKASAQDPIDMVSGTFGLTGAVDSVIVIQKVTRGETYDESKFSFMGRDIDEQELAMKFDKRNHKWSVIGDADTHFISNTRKEILKNLGDGSMTPGELTKLMSGQKVSTIQTLLIKMLKGGQVDKDSKGRYSVFKIQINSKRFRKKGD